MRRAAVLLGSVAWVLLLPAPALGHGDLQGTSPEDGATVAKAPKEVRITLTEAPSRGAEARASDGCKRKVPAAVSVDGSDIVLAIDGGEPGKWQVSYRAVSSVDGHQTNGKLGFTVSGKKDCSREAEEPEDQIDAADDPGIVENPNPPDEGGGSWLLWVAGGTVALVIMAFLLRRYSQ